MHTVSRRCFDDDGDGVGHAVGVRFDVGAPTIDEVGGLAANAAHIAGRVADIPICFRARSGTRSFMASRGCVM